MNNIRIRNGVFETCTPEQQGISSNAINECISKIIDTHLNVHSFYIFRNGYMLAGGCAKPFNEKMPRRVYSTMKSVVVLAIYFLVQEGKLSFDDKIIKYFPESLPNTLPKHAENLRVKDVLMMAVGHERDSLREYHQNKHGIGMVPLTYRDGAQPEMNDVAGKTMPQLFFSMPFEREPGEIFWYNNSIPEIIGMLVEKISGEDYISYLKPRLFDPLGINDIRVNKNIEENGYAWNDGATTTICIEDLCKFALFYLQRGSWEGRQLLDASIIDEGTANHIATAEFVRKGHGMSEKDEYGYGYQIWRNKFGGYRMVGGSGQEAIIMPEEQLVIVYTSFDRDTAAPGKNIDEIICETIFKTMKRDALKDDTSAHSNLKMTFANWTIASTKIMTFDDKTDDTKSKTYVVKENVFGIKEVTTDFIHNKLHIKQNGKEFDLSFGVKGNFEKNSNGIGHKPDGYSEIYGANQNECFVTAGFICNGLELLFEYSGSMAPHLITFTFSNNEAEVKE